MVSGNSDPVGCRGAANRGSLARARELISIGNGDAGASVRVTGSRCLTGGERQTSSQTHRLNPGRANGQFRRVSPAMDLHIRWLKIKNPRYSQNEGSGELFNRERPAHSAR